MYLGCAVIYIVVIISLLCVIVVRPENKKLQLGAFKF